MTEQSSEAVAEFINILIAFLYDAAPQLPEGELRTAIESLLSDIQDQTNAGESTNAD